MNRAAVIQAAGLMCMAYGQKPSRRNIQRVIAETNNGKTFYTNEIADFLRKNPFSVPNEYNSSTSSVPQSVPQPTLKTADLVPREALLQYKTSTPRARAAKVLVLKSGSSETTVSSPPLGLTPEVGEGGTGKKPSVDRRSAAEVEADNAIERIRPELEPVLHGMTWTAWRRRNRQHVVDMARSGLDAAAIVATWQEHTDRLGEPVRSIAHLQAWCNRPDVSASDMEADPYAHLPLATDLPDSPDDWEPPKDRITWLTAPWRLWQIESEKHAAEQAARDIA